MWLRVPLLLSTVILYGLFLLTALRVTRRERMLVRRARAVRRVQGGAR